MRHPQFNSPALPNMPPLTSDSMLFQQSPPLYIRGSLQGTSLNGMNGNGSMGMGGNGSMGMGSNGMNGNGMDMNNDISNRIFQYPSNGNINGNGNDEPPRVLFPGLAKMIKKLGEPDLADSANGGIAIWSGRNLRNKGYPYFRRIEMIDERVRCAIPVKHASNIYIWVDIQLTNTQLHKILDLSPNLLYDQKKRSLIIRSDSLNGAVAVAALLKLYSQGTLSMHQIYNNDLLKKYYLATKKRSGSYDRHAKRNFYRILRA